MTAAKGVGSEGGTPVTLRALRYPVSLRRPFEQPVDSAQLRRRVLVFAGMWFLLAGMLAALGLIAVLLVSVALALIGVALLGGAWLLRRYPGATVAAIRPQFDRARFPGSTGAARRARAPATTAALRDPIRLSSRPVESARLTDFSDGTSRKRARASATTAALRDPIRPSGRPVESARLGDFPDGTGHDRPPESSASTQ